MGSTGLAPKQVSPVLQPCAHPSISKSLSRPLAFTVRCGDFVLVQAPCRKISTAACFGNLRAGTGRGSNTKYLNELQAISVINIVKAG